MEAEVGSSLKDVSNLQETSEHLNCDLCGLSHIHKNDFANHLKSRSHQKKLLGDKTVNKDDKRRFQCECCNTTLRGEEFYQIHLGSKTHKRNLKKHALIGQAKPPVAPPAQVNRSSKRFRRISIGTHGVEQVYAEFVRQKYKTYPVNDDLDYLQYKTYICSLTAYLSLRLALDQNVTDFMISVNDKGWQTFGNVVIRLSTKDKKVIYAIQCKRVNQSHRQINCFEEARVDIEKQYNVIAQLRDAGKDVSETRFVIFSTCGTSMNFNHSVTLKPSVLNKWKTSGEDVHTDSVLKVRSFTKKNEIINVTSDPENVYLFTLSDNNNYNLPKLFFYSSQRIFPSMFNPLLKSKFDKSPDISAEYIKYIDNWIDGKLGGNYKLNKRDVVLKIGEILLSPFVVSPKRVHSKHDAFPVWNQVISNVDLTVLKNELFIISKVCQPLNMIIEETLSTTIDTITKTINLKDTLHRVGEPIKSYLFEIGQERLKEDIPLNIVYNIFWKAGRIPLLMNTEGREDGKDFILDIILFMKLMGVHKKFIIKSADFNLNRIKENLRVFTCLDDIKNLIDWNSVEIWVSDAFHLPLSAIISSDPFFLKWVTPNIFFDISVGRYSFKPSYSVKKIHNSKDVLKIILNDDIKDILESELYPERYQSDTTDSGYYCQNRLRGVEPNIL